MSALPPIRSKHRVCVICEGFEDYHYFKRLMDLNVWNSAYNFTLINVKSASNIPARFQNEYQNDRYEIILVFCDTDKEPYREYAQVKTKINNFLGKRKVAEKSYYLCQSLYHADRAVTLWRYLAEKPGKENKQFCHRTDDRNPEL